MVHTPAKVVFGREIRLPCDLAFGTPSSEALEVGDYAEQLRKRLLDIHDLVRERIRLASDKMKARYDLRANSAGYQEGELVWLDNTQRKEGKARTERRSWR